MADYIFIRKSRNAISSLLHIFLNVLLAVVAVGVTVVTGTPVIGLFLIVVSKWRVFAVNHRYWLLNIRSSLVDFIAQVSFVLLAYAAGTTFLPVHFLLMAGYAIWLILIKPRSSMRFATIQALAAILLGTTAATVFAALSDVLVLVVAEFIIGFAASHHVLVQGNDTEPSLISLVLGLVFAEISWLAYSWLIIYTFGATGLCVSQLAIILTLIGFGYFKVYGEMAKNSGKLHIRELALPLAFVAVMIVILVVGFSQPRFNIH